MATLKEQNKHQNEKTPLQTNTKKNKSNIISIVMKAGAPSLNPMYLYKILPQKLSILKQFEIDSSSSLSIYTSFFMGDAQPDQGLTDICVWAAIRSATKRLLVRILRTQQFLTY